jgi:hypothetical protein
MEFFDITELRVGNLLTTIKGTKHYKRELEVENIIYNNPNIDESLTLLNGYETHAIKSIPLNEEWLLKFGFKYKRPSAGGQDQWAGFGIWGYGDFYLLGYKKGFEYWYGRQYEIKYVHQLQNLYFALTGEELTLNEI